MLVCYQKCISSVNIVIRVSYFIVNIACLVSCDVMESATGSKKAYRPTAPFKVARLNYYCQPYQNHDFFVWLSNWAVDVNYSFPMTQIDTFKVIAKENAKRML